MAEAYKFPDEVDSTDTKSVEIENESTEIEIEIVDDTPPRRPWPQAIGTRSG